MIYYFFLSRRTAGTSYKYVNTAMENGFHIPISNVRAVLNDNLLCDQVQFYMTICFVDQMQF